jgi:hypothetical protein
MARALSRVHTMRHSIGRSNTTKGNIIGRSHIAIEILSSRNICTTRIAKANQKYVNCLYIA